MSDGSIVKKGDVVCELDSAGLADSLTDQKIASIQAQAAYKRSLTAREVAEMSMKEYSDYLFQIELYEVEAATSKAESELAKAEGRAEHGAKNVPLKALRFALEASQLRRKLLREVSRPKRLKELELAIAAASAEELTSQARWDSELTKEKRIEHEIKACKIVAPRDGKLVYFYGVEGEKPRTAWKSDGSVAPWPFIEVGAQVQPHQLLFKIIPVTEPAAQPE